uniref:Uncharacterized protein n=1 Tax=Chromera velia CCMP2878 TaxID=1169474 RepID=A0A0G4GB34_9ALVE|eukprot:Cvel_21099.t1-p1 / transcript=Cvel_21099.t1 / gene=Cvel_21099 / organism=Chromera_velia_CCMP2878 / gene_product=hypothetical protein / transcript_product=hypothetical protein / location=Cvel_scaffold1951:14582-23338(-) / protein_length=1536 / sequence_SO=supercontig / SO=protein_coding / is_pseudo=false
MADPGEPLAAQEPFLRHLKAMKHTLAVQLRDNRLQVPSGEGGGRRPLSLSVSHEGEARGESSPSQQQTGNGTSRDTPGVSRLVPVLSSHWNGATPPGAGKETGLGLARAAAALQTHRVRSAYDQPSFSSRDPGPASSSFPQRDRDRERDSRLVAENTRLKRQVADLAASKTQTEGKCKALQAKADEAAGKASQAVKKTSEWRTKHQEALERVAELEKVTFRMDEEVHRLRKQLSLTVPRTELERVEEELELAQRCANTRDEALEDAVRLLEAERNLRGAFEDRVRMWREKNVGAPSGSRAREREREKEKERERSRGAAKKGPPPGGLTAAVELAASTAREQERARWRKERGVGDPPSGSHSGGDGGQLLNAGDLEELLFRMVCLEESDAELQSARQSIRLKDERIRVLSRDCEKKTQSATEATKRAEESERKRQSSQTRLSQLRGRCHQLRTREESLQQEVAKLRTESQNLIDQQRELLAIVSLCADVVPAAAAAVQQQQQREVEKEEEMQRKRMEFLNPPSASPESPSGHEAVSKSAHRVFDELSGREKPGTSAPPSHSHATTVRKVPSAEDATSSSERERQREAPPPPAGSHRACSLEPPPPPHQSLRAPPGKAPTSFAQSVSSSSSSKARGAEKVNRESLPCPPPHQDPIPVAHAEHVKEKEEEGEAQGLRPRGSREGVGGTQSDDAEGMDALPATSTMIGCDSGATFSLSSVLPVHPDSLHTVTVGGTPQVPPGPSSSFSLPLSANTSLQVLPLPTQTSAAPPPMHRKRGVPSRNAQSGIPCSVSPSPTPPSSLPSPSMPIPYDCRPKESRLQRERERERNAPQAPSRSSPPFPLSPRGRQLHRGGSALKSPKKSPGGAKGKGNSTSSLSFSPRPSPVLSPRQKIPKPKQKGKEVVYSFCQIEEGAKGQKHSLQKYREPTGLPIASAARASMRARGSRGVPHASGSISSSPPPSAAVSPPGCRQGDQREFETTARPKHHGGLALPSVESQGQGHSPPSPSPRRASPAAPSGCPPSQRANRCSPSMQSPPSASADASPLAMRSIESLVRRSVRGDSSEGEGGQSGWRDQRALDESTHLRRVIEKQNLIIAQLENYSAAAIQQAFREHRRRRSLEEDAQRRQVTAAAAAPAGFSSDFQASSLYVPRTNLHQVSSQQLCGDPVTVRQGAAAMYSQSQIDQGGRGMGSQGDHRVNSLSFEFGSDDLNQARRFETRLTAAATVSKEPEEGVRLSAAVLSLPTPPPPTLSHGTTQEKERVAGAQAAAVTVTLSSGSQKGMSPTALAPSGDPSFDPPHRRSSRHLQYEQRQMREGGQRETCNAISRNGLMEGDRQRGGVPAGDYRQAYLQEEERERERQTAREREENVPRAPPLAHAQPDQEWVTAPSMPIRRSIQAAPSPSPPSSSESPALPTYAQPHHADPPAPLAPPSPDSFCDPVLSCHSSPSSCPPRERDWRAREEEIEEEEEDLREEEAMQAEGEVTFGKWRENAEEYMNGHAQTHTEGNEGKVKREVDSGTEGEIDWAESGKGRGEESHAFQ